MVLCHGSGGCLLVLQESIFDKIVEEQKMFWTEKIEPELIIYVNKNKNYKI